MAKKTKSEVEQVASTKTASTPAATPLKKATPTKSKASAATHKAAAKPANVAAVINAKKAVEVTPEKPEVVAVNTSAETHMIAALHRSVRDETELATQEVLDEREETARISYSYWVERRFAAGDPLHDWLRAEHEFRVRRLATV